MQANKRQTILADRLQPEKEIAPGYDDFFTDLLQIIKCGPIDNNLGELMKKQILGYLAQHPLRGFDDYADTGYRRTYLGSSPETGWEALVMSWKAGNTTSIHAHPQFAGYNFADGRFRVEVFKPIGDGAVQLVQTFNVESPDGFYAVGRAGSFDNHIHRITCLSDTGHSLHVYSDDARKGFVYDRIVP